jgi:hypothetical protein
MTIEQLDTWLENNKSIEWSYDGEKDCFYLRDLNTPYYVDHPDCYTVVSGEAMGRIDGIELYKEINKGLKVEGITRCTGYFSKTTQWNKGKLGELKDRYREGYK